EKTRTDAGGRQPVGLAAEKLEPVAGVTSFRVGEGEQDLALLARLALGELAVHAGFGPLVDHVLGPATTVSGGRLRRSRDGHGCPHNAGGRGRECLRQRYPDGTGEPPE